MLGERSVVWVLSDHEALGLQPKSLSHLVPVLHTCTSLFAKDAVCILCERMCTMFTCQTFYAKGCAKCSILIPHQFSLLRFSSPTLEELQQVSDGTHDCLLRMCTSSLSLMSLEGFPLKTGHSKPCPIVHDIGT